jgi:hypothetical protein
MLVGEKYSSQVACVVECGSPLPLYVQTFGALALLYPSVETPQNCETNPISFKTCCPSNTNIKFFSFLLKSKSYDPSRPCQNVADPLPKMLPFKPLTSNDVTDVAAFPTSYTETPVADLPSCPGILVIKKLLKASKAWLSLLKAAKAKINNHFYFLKPETLNLKPYAAFWKAIEAYRSPWGWEGPFTFFAYGTLPLSRLKFVSIRAIRVKKSVFICVHPWLKSKNEND